MSTRSIEIEDQKLAEKTANQINVDCSKKEQGSVITETLTVHENEFRFG